MMRKPTKGPWYRDDSMVEHSCCWEAAIVADVPKGEGNYGGTKALVAECLEGDVNLIKAAPDLLDALKDCRNAMHADNPADGWAEIIAAADVAIAKAEGRS